MGGQGQGLTVYLVNTCKYTVRCTSTAKKKTTGCSLWLHAPDKSSAGKRDIQLFRFTCVCALPVPTQQPSPQEIFCPREEVQMQGSLVSKNLYIWWAGVIGQGQIWFGSSVCTRAAWCTKPLEECRAVCTSLASVPGKHLHR